MSDFAPTIIERPLPGEVTACHAYIGRLEAVTVELQAALDARQAEEAKLKATLDAQQAEAARLQAELQILKMKLFGRRSEKSGRKPDEPTNQEIQEEQKPPKKKNKRNGGGRDALPPHLPRVTTVVDVPEEEKVCPCCGKRMKPIGVDVSEKLDAKPIELFVRRTERPRYACGTCKSGVVQAPMPAQTLPKTNCTSGLAALLMLWKYEDHLPLNRLERILCRSHIDLDRGRMCEWLMTVGDLVEPLVDRMEGCIIASGYACADETRLPMQAPGHTKQCWLWASRGLDGLAPYTVFRFSETRGASGLPAAYKTFNGRLMTDAYAVYDKITAELETITLHGCLVHARRKFVEAKDAGDCAAQEAIAIIADIYEVENLARDLPPDERLALRLERSAPQFDRLKEWLGRHSDCVPKSPLGKAVNYTLDRWPCIIRALEDGRMPIDNNALERDIRPIALGRKNWLFAGSPRGGKMAAVFFSLIESCKRAGHNTFEYISDVLSRIGQHPANRLDELLPDKWAPPAPSATSTAN